MKKICKWLLPLFLITLIWVPKHAFADSAPGDVIVTLGEDLTSEQKTKILNEMGVPSNVEAITVSNKEEYEYLGKYISRAKIGTRAISSAKITLAETGKGLHVKTNHINWVTADMITNALVTAGVKDADIYVTAPFDVSGTAALTGILKAYETKTDITIPEGQKQVANEEVIKTAQLGDRIGTDKATQLITEIKQELAKNPAKTTEEMQALIQRVADRLGITLTDADLKSLVALFDHMKDVHIDWDKVKDGLQNVRDNLNHVINKEETKNFLEKILDFIMNIINAIIDFFKGLFA
ncbi:DUF1002 domain-containing protein [Fictibacillus gelatini]|uniref:DUF1002 domain-containing protein n=1 Tax=Fictibacillus gelatini TaxID=225985 RepID=UPI00040ACB8B|nr:DUF1002 domain-containing protein [Fictibacillus gelatini]